MDTKTMGIRLGYDQFAAVEQKCRETGLTKAELLMTAVNGSTPKSASATPKALEEARRAGILEGRTAAHEEMAKRIDHLQAAVNKAERVTLEAAEDRAYLEAWRSNSKLLGDPRPKASWSAETDALVSCAKAILG